MMLTERLKNETQQLHIEVEKLILPHIKNMNTAADYVRLLHIFYGFFSPLEFLVQQQLTSNTIPDWNERRKSDSMVKDAEKYSVDLKALSTSADMPQIDNEAQALGAMYVMEGSTLGGVHLVKMIEKRLGNNVQGALAFFNGYGQETMHRWNGFKDHLNAFANTTESQNDVVCAANNTFNKFKLWIGLNQTSCS